MLFLEGEKRIFAAISDEISRQAFRDIFTTGSIETIIWMEENGGILHEELALVLARHGRLDVIKVLVDKFNWKCGNLVLTAVNCKQLETAGWLLKNTNDWNAGLVVVYLYETHIEDPMFG